MKSQISRHTRNWRLLLLASAIPALASCSRIDGSVELNNSSGEPYSFEGATAEVFDFDRNAALDGETKTSKGRGTVDAAGAIALQVVAATIIDNALYSVEIRCPAGNTTDACNVESPLHVVLSGSQLKANGWKATALSEAVFHNTAYYAAVDYDTTDIQQMQDRYADALLAQPGATTYSDLLAWDADATDAVKRPYLLGSFSEALATGAGATDIKRLARQWVGPYVGQLDLPVAENAYISGVAIANDHAYIGHGTSLWIADLNNPEQPALVGTFEATTRTFDDLVSSGDHPYSMFEGTLYVSDVSNPLQPTNAAEVYLSYDVKRLAVAGDYLYGLKDGSFVIVDISDPAAPVQTAEVQRGYLAIAAFGTTVAVSDYGGFHLIDTSNPAAPVARGRLPFGVPETDSHLPEIIVLSQNHAYAANYGTLSIIDISNLDAPVIVATLESREITGMTLDGTQLYLTGNNLITRVDVSDAAAPVVTATVNIASSEFPSLQVVEADGYLYTLNTLRLSATLSVVDVDAVTGAVVPSAGLAFANPDNVARFIGASDNRTFLQNSSGFSIIDTSTAGAPTLIDSHNVTRLEDATVSGDNLFAIASYPRRALSVLDVSDPNEPVTIGGSITFGGSSDPFDLLRDITQSGNRLYVAWSYNSFWGNIPGCTADPLDGHAGGLFVIDVSSPTAPSLSGQACLQQYADVVAASNDYAYLGVEDGSLQVVDVSNPTTPALGGTVQLSSTPNSLAVTGSHVWATAGTAGIDIVSVGNAAAPAVTSHIDTVGQAGGITFDQTYAYVADGDGGVQIFDIADAAAPVQLASITTSGVALSTAKVDDYIYVATPTGVEVFRALPVSQ